MKVINKFFNTSLLILIIIGSSLKGQIDNYEFNNPIPTGKTLLDSYVLENGKGKIIVGRHGLIMRSDGMTWDKIYSGTTSHLTDIHFIDMNNGWIVGDNGTILKTSDSGFTWNRQEAGNNYSFNAVKFINQNYGVIVGWSVILYTSDGGLNWNQSTTSINDPFYDVSLLSDGYAYAVGISGKVLKSTDAGLTWTELATPITKRLTGVDFLDKNIGWISGWQGTLLHTTDGGVTWAVSFPISYDLNGVSFVNPSLGFIIGDYGTIMRTTDSGTTWESMPTNITSRLFTINYSGNESYKNILAGGDYGHLIHSTDFGETWVDLRTSFTDSGITKTFFSDNDHGWIISLDGLFRTTDGGNNWEPSDNGIDYSLGQKAIFFTDANVGYAGTSDGKIFKSTDSGVNWVEIYNWLGNSIREIFFIDEMNGWALAYSNVILKTTDAGANWSEINIPAYSYSMNSIYFVTQLVGFIAGENGKLLRTLDGGLTWQSLYAGSGYFQSVNFADENNGFAVGSDGLCYRTENGGTSWYPVNFDSNYDFSEVFFSSPNNGWLVGTVSNNYQGLLLYTTDGGINWYKSYSYVYGGLYSCFFFDYGIGWVGGANGAVVKYNYNSDGNSLDLLYPTDGEIVEMNTEIQILWSSLNINNIRLEISTNGGINWSLITISPASNGSYNWTIPYIRDNEFLLRVSDEINSNINDESGIIFANDPPVQWTSISNIGNFYFYDIFFTDKNVGWALSSSKIFSTSNGGANWEEQISGLSLMKSIFFIDNQTGWAVGSHGKIVRTTDGGLNWLIVNGLPSRYLNDVYFIDSMNGWVAMDGGEILKSFDGGITWETINLPTSSSINRITFPNPYVGYAIASDFTKIYKSTDGGSNWIQINISAGQNGDPTSLFFIDENTGWLTTSTRYCVKTTDGGLTWNSVLVDQEYLNDIYFIDDNVGWIVGLSGYSSRTTDGGTTWQYNSTGVDENLNSIYIQSPLNIWACGGAGVLKYTGNTTPFVELQTPNGGESFYFGDSTNIEWVSSNVGNVKLEYTSNGGTYWNTIVSSTVANSGIFPWLVPGIASDNYKVRVSDESNNTFYDLSNNTFSVIDTTVSLIVTAPNGGESLAADQTFPITWSQINVENIKLEFSIDGSANWSQIIASFPAAVGTYHWRIPNTPSENCLVRISTVTDGTVFDESDAIFIITSNSESLTIITPNGGEDLKIGTIKNIKWSLGTGNVSPQREIETAGVEDHLAISNVKLEFTFNDGQNWILIEDGVDATVQTYAWLVPNIPSNLCKIRISNSDDATQNDISNAVFAISDGFLQNRYILDIIGSDGVFGDTVSAFVNLGVQENTSFSSGFVNLSGFQNQLTFLRVDTTNSVLGGTDVIISPNDTDTLLYISFATSEQISESGLLFTLDFIITNGDSAIIPLHVDSVLIDTGIYTVESIDGQIRVLQPFYGDVDLNTLVQPYDASYLLQHLVGYIPELSPQQIVNADVTIDGTLSALDASAILQYTAGLIDTFPFSRVIEPFGSFDMPEAVGFGDSLFIVPIEITGADSIYSFECMFEYSNEYIHYNGIQLGESINNYTIYSREINNVITIVGAADQSFLENGTFLYLSFKKNYQNDFDDSYLFFKELRLNEDIVRLDIDSTLISLLVDIEENEETPTSFNLEQNYPNPFNPSTIIRFGLPENVKVTLNVFNVLGEKVAMLINKEMQAGNHSVEFNGTDLSSGLYLYQISAGNYYSVKKMLLIK